MTFTPAKAEAPVCLSKILSEQRAGLNEQLRSLWQVLEHICEDRLAEIEDRLAAGLAGTHAEESAAARHELIGKLQGSIQRLRSCATREEWTTALLDAAQSFCARVGVFEFTGDALKGIRASGIDQASQELFTALKIPVKSIAGFTEAGGQAYTDPGEEVRGKLRTIFGNSETPGLMFPVAGSNHIEALLYAEPGGLPFEKSGLELVCALAEWSLRPIEKSSPEAGGGSASQPDFSFMTRADRELHLKAQRFARVKVAEMLLYKPAAVRAGRARRNVYGELGKEIDFGRELFRDRFLGWSSTMADYFHLELVRTIANDDSNLLGQEYPGPLV